MRTHDGAMNVTLARLVFGFGRCEKLDHRHPTAMAGKLRMWRRRRSPIKVIKLTRDA